jgi:cytochrome b
MLIGRPLLGLTGCLNHGRQRPPTDMGAPATHTVRVWDAPLRVFHWALVAAVSTAIVTGLQGGDRMALHGQAGIATAGLLVFRLVWGLVGSETARFRSFVRGPSAISAYLRGQWQGLGHNPLGAFSVLAILGLLTIQVLTGLFGNDEIAFTGPLSRWVSEDTSIWLTGKHRLAVYGVYAILALHVLAIAGYKFFKKEALVPPMLHGRKRVEQAVEAPGSAPNWALPVALFVGFGAAALAAGLWPR